MGKTSKFSFPLPGRKDRLNKTSEDLTLPEEPKLSKVERLLGTTDLPPQYQIAANKNALLSRQPSSLTLNLYEPTITDGHSSIDSPIPDVPAVPQSSMWNLGFDSPWASQVSLAPPRSMSVSQAQPPRHYSEAPKRNHPRSQSSNDVFSVQHAELRPSTTNNGHSYTAIQLKPYASNVPEPAHGQRSSNGNSHKLFPVVETTSSNPSYPTESYPLSGFKPGVQPMQKKRPTRLDLSKLLGRAAAASTPALKSVTSPNSAGISHNPPRFPSDVRSPPNVTSPPLKLSMSRRMGKKTSSTTTRAGEQAPRPKTAGCIDDKKLQSTKASHGKSRASKHWFDGLVEAEDDVFSDHDTAIDAQGPLSTDYSIRPVQASPAQQEQRLHHNQMSPVKARRHQEHQPRAQEESLSVPTAYSGAARCIRPTCSERLDQIMQKQPSPLISDFSEDFEDSNQQPNIGKPDHLPAVRESVALSDIDEAVTIGEAQVLHVRPQRKLSGAETVQVKRVQQSTQLRVVNVSRSNTVSREPSPNIAAQKALPGAAAVTSPRTESKDYPRPALTKSNPTSARASLLSNGPTSSDPRHKMMAVTAEEEALLAMMRQKRAAMQSHSFAEGFKSAMMSSPQSPHFQTDSHVLRHNSIESEARASRVKPSPMPSVRSSNRSPCIELDTSSFAPIMAPQPTRVYASPSKTLMHAGFESSASLELYNQSFPQGEQGLFTSPETGHSIFDATVSEKSVHSGTHSPVTPHSASASIRITMNSMPWIDSDDFLDDVFEVSKPDHIDSSPSNRSLVCESVRSAVVPLTADLSLVNEEREAFHPLPSSAHIVQQYKFRARNAAANQEIHKPQPSTSQLTARSHEHRHGRCGVKDTRCSVAVDVMDAWANLGGWQDQRHPLY